MIGRWLCYLGFHDRHEIAGEDPRVVITLCQRPFCRRFFYARHPL